jgi:hypothetical protein
MTPYWLPCHSSERRNPGYLATIRPVTPIEIKYPIKEEEL